jgi:hypothetical protein
MCIACCGAVGPQRREARDGAKLVQVFALRLVRVRAAPQRSARIRQRASAVHGRRAFVHARRSAHVERQLARRFTLTIVSGVPGGTELFRGYACSEHPIAAAATCATIDLYEREQLFERATRMALLFGNASTSCAANGM